MPDDNNALLAAAQRDRTRIIVVFSAVLAVVAITLTAGWVSAWNGREAWREQAMTWQQRYIELYDEFTAETGEEPSAPEPADVAAKAPESIPGPPGTVGPRGADGRSIIGPPGADGLPGADSITPGPAGAPGKDGKNGTDGAASTVPGPQGPQGEAGAPGAPGATGPQGEPGPTCPTGYAPTEAWVPVAADQTATPILTQTIVCTRTEGETP